MVYLFIVSLIKVYSVENEQFVDLFRSVSLSRDALFEPALIGATNCCPLERGPV